MLLPRRWMLNLKAVDGKYQVLVLGREAAIKALQAWPKSSILWKTEPEFRIMDVVIKRNANLGETCDMARYLGPKCKLDRALKVDLSLKVVFVPESKCNKMYLLGCMARNVCVSQAIMVSGALQSSCEAYVWDFRKTIQTSF